MVRPDFAGVGANNVLNLDSSPGENVEVWRRRLTSATIVSQIAADQIYSGSDPQRVLNFARGNLTGFAWAGARDIGGFEVVVAALTPGGRGAKDKLKGDDFAKALGGLSADDASETAPNIARSTFFLNARSTQSTDAALRVTWQPSLGPNGFEISTRLGASPGIVPGQRNEIFNLNDIRFGLDGKNAANSSGILIKIPGLEGVLNELSQKLLTYIAAQTASKSASGYSSTLVNDFLASLSASGGLARGDWQTFGGPVWRAAVDMNPQRIADSTISFQGQTVSLGDISRALSQFANNADSALADVLSSVNLETRRRSADDIFMTPRKDAEGAAIDNMGYISQKVSETLNQGADALSLLSAAWKVWDNQNNNQTLRENAAAVFHASDPRMQIAQVLAVSFYAGAREAMGERRRQPLKFSEMSPAERQAMFSADGLSAKKEMAFSDFQINRINPILNALYTQLTKTDSRQFAQNEINARIQSFAEQLIRMGINVNLGSTSIEAALTTASQQNPRNAPIENQNLLQSYFARDDLKKLNSTFAQSVERVDAPPITRGEIKRLYLYAGEERTTAWQQILNEAALGRVDLFEALAAVKEGGGATNPTTAAIDAMRGELTALLTAPIADREHLAKLYDLPPEPDIAKLNQQRADILSRYEKNPTFENMIEALHARVKIEPLFGITLQDYFLTRNVNLPLDLFSPVPPDVEHNELFDTDDALPAPPSETLTAEQGESVASCIVRTSVQASGLEAPQPVPALPPPDEDKRPDEVAFPPMLVAAGYSNVQAPLSGGAAWFVNRHKGLTDRIAMKRQPVVLLCWEGGSDPGHAAHISYIAKSLSDKGGRCVVAAFDRRSLVDLAEDSQEVIAAPQERFGREQAPAFPPSPHFQDSINFTKYLWRLGFWRGSTVLANLKAWDKIITRVQPDVVAAYFAPFALLAAIGRVPTVTIGNGLVVPAVANGYFTLDGKAPSDFDREAQGNLFSIVEQAYDEAGMLAPGSIAGALCGDVQCPASLPALDPRYALRPDGLAPPIMDRLPAIAEGRGRCALISVGDQPIDYLPTIAAVAKACPKTILYAKRGSKILSTGSLPANVEIQREPFSAEDIARRAVLLVHSGSIDMTQIAALAGVPQLIAYGGGEGWFNASAVSRLNAGAGLAAEDARADAVEELAFALSNTVLYSAGARSWAEQSHRWIAGRRGADVVCETIMYAVV